MKRLTLDETWKRCMQMWRWIAKKIKKDPLLQIEALKEAWLKNHKIPIYSIDSNCFFCEYASTHKHSFLKPCISCPAVKICADFDCTGGGLNYAREPLAFHAKLEELYKIYKKKKARKK